MHFHAFSYKAFHFKGIYIFSLCKYGLTCVSFPIVAVLQPHTDASCKILPAVGHVGSLRTFKIRKEQILFANIILSIQAYYQKIRKSKY